MKIPPASKCLAKVTNFFVTIACYLDGSDGSATHYIIEIEAIDRETFKKQPWPTTAKTGWLTPKDAVGTFNRIAKEHGFKKRIFLEDFKEK